MVFRSNRKFDRLANNSTNIFEIFKLFIVYLEILHTTPAEVNDNRTMWLTFSTKKTPTVHKKWLKYDDSDYSKYIFCQQHTLQ